MYVTSGAQPQSYDVTVVLVVESVKWMKVPLRLGRPTEVEAEKEYEDNPLRDLDDNRNHEAEKNGEYEDNYLKKCYAENNILNIAVPDAREVAWDADNNLLNITEKFL